MALAGLWPLTECHIEGPFELGQIARLLPITLQHLHVAVRPVKYGAPEFSNGDQICLSMYQRFSSLRVLHVELHESEEYLGNSKNSTFELDCPFPSLIDLHLSPWPVYYDGTLSDLVPGLRRAALVSDTGAQEFAGLPQIDYLGLVLIQQTRRGVVHFVVKADSHLRRLTLLADTEATLDIRLHKADFLYDCSSIDKAWFMSNAGTPGLDHTLPKHFHSLPFPLQHF